MCILGGGHNIRGKPKSMSKLSLPPIPCLYQINFLFIHFLLLSLDSMIVWSVWNGIYHYHVCLPRNFVFCNIPVLEHYHDIIFISVFTNIMPSSSIHLHSKVAAVLQRPNGMTLNYQSPCSPISVEKAVFSQSPRCIFICQCPLFKSRVENHSFPESVSSISSMEEGNYPFS